MAVKALGTEKGSRNEKRLRPAPYRRVSQYLLGGQREGQVKPWTSGWRMLQSDHLVVLNAAFECRIYAPGLSWSLRIDEAQVHGLRKCWYGIAAMHPDNGRSQATYR